jgi:integrase
LRNSWLSYTQQKNRKRKPVKVEVPLPPELAAAIEACPAPREALTFLTNEQGKPFGKNYFGEWFAQQVTAAGLPDNCRAHGLRKASCTTMAQSDCTPHEIMAISGHTTLKEVERYTKAANKKQLAVRAQAKVANAAKTESNIIPLAVAAKRGA